MTDSSSPSRARGWDLVERHESDCTIVAIAGVVDMAAAPALAVRIRTILQRRPAVLVIDLSAIDFLATAGMSIIMEAHRRSGEISSTCRIVAEGPVTLRPMQLLGIDEVLDVYPTVAAAVNANRGT